ncbi:MAG: DUF1460 domain-containing protein [Ignavibacteriae bacterium]|nr:DUF1460 domain-containing protein [Ignavibacteriota bacterium]
MIRKICFNPFHIYTVAVLFILVLIIPSISKADDEYEISKCRKKLEKFKNSGLSFNEMEIGEIIAEVGKSFLGTEYVAGTLDENTGPEKLVIKITGLDCVTFVECTLAMSRMFKKDKFDMDSFKKELQYIRYRQGEIEGYSSRLHYFTDWILDNEQKGVVKDVTKEIGGTAYNKNIDFMTTHISLYKQLTENDDFTNDMRNVEKTLNKNQFYYIPKSVVDDYYDLLRTGDIIATTTDIKGLDVTHTGFVYKDNGKTYFLHASIQKKKVIISDEELKEYLKGNKKQSGIIVARPVAP